MSKILRRQMQLSDLSKQSRFGLFVDLSDPLPLVYDWLNSRFANVPGVPVQA
jgi:hypothetical protein